MKKQEREEYLKQRLIEMKTYENALWEKGVFHIAGVDEVGRGPLAGPVVAAAVILPQDFDVLGVDDSKKVSEKKRKELFEVIKERAVAYGIGMACETVIDDINILEATKKAMEEAIERAGEMLAQREANGKIGHVLFDAITIKNVDIPQTSIVKGDAKSVSIAAASILAKVTRDTLMEEYHKEYPAYSFDQNKGYGTKAHYEGIKMEGICPIHRLTFLKNLSEKR